MCYFASFCLQFRSQYHFFPGFLLMPDTLVFCDGNVLMLCSQFISMTLLTYSAVYLLCNSLSGGLVRITFKIENLTVQSQDIGQVCQHCTVVYTPMGAGIVMEQQQFLPFPCGMNLTKAGIQFLCFNAVVRIHCCSHTQILHKTNTFLILNACNHGT